MSGSQFPAQQEAFDGLSAAAALIDPASAQAVAELAEQIKNWLELASQDLPEMAQCRPIAEQVILGLRQGFDSTPGFERLNRILALAQSVLEGASQAPQPGLEKTHRVDDLERDSWNDFLLECPELVGLIEGQLLASMRNGSFDPLSVMRPLHTLKGICGMLGLEAQSGLMHACEDALDPYRQSNSLPQLRARAVLAAMDCLRNQADAIAAGLKQGSFPIIDAGPALLGLQSLAPEMPSEAASSENGPAPQMVESEPGTRSADNVIRIPVSKMDSLLEAVGELAICQAQVTAGIRELDLQGLIATEASRLEKISRQLQQVVLGLRMVPVQPLFNRISRQAYDLSQRMGKPLRVEISGGETEVDKGLIEELFEPLLHLVRNALDHGMDTPEERKASGKPEQGLLRLAAFHQGGDFVLQMADDGRGFDLASIAAKCRTLGLIKAGEEPGAEWLIGQLFNAGFSTAAALTDLSGRGVGLNAVRRKVTDLKGTVTASHQPNQGATFTLRLPLTLALMDAILVRVKGERFALPAAQVMRFLAWDDKARHSLSQSGAWMEAGGRSLPLVELGASRDGRAVAMHVAVAGREACLVVDEVLGKQQVVVKALGGLLQNLPGIGGGAVLADGRVGMILDLESLLKQRAIA